jgi:hypothetical protein
MRFMIFPVLGPLFGFMTLTVITGSAFDEGLLSRITYAIPFVYVLGIVPALLTCFVDWLLRKVSWRPLYTGIAGYVMTYVLFLPPFEFKSSATKGLLLFGIGGAVAGAFCSWLSGIFQQRERGM